MSVLAKVSQLIFLIFVQIYLTECRRFGIVGGESTNIQSFPFQVVYLSHGNFVCSGSIIAPRFILTSAHCTFYFPRRLSVRFGSSYRNRGGIIVNVVGYSQHPNFNFRTFDYDLSILRLETDIQYSSLIQPVKLPKENTVLPVGTNCTVSGWGMMNFDDTNDPPELLRSAKIEIKNHRKCSDTFAGKYTYISDNMLCVGAPDYSKDACLGDSGGPLICDGVLHGVVSFGYQCAKRGFPGVYASVAAAMPWVDFVISSQKRNT